MTETRNPGGRPLKYQSVKQLEDAIDAYFRSCHDDEGVLKTPYTITGLALALDTSRETLCNYEEREEFFDTVKRAKLRCENFAEVQLYISKNSAGPIFALKNYGWKDSINQNIGGQEGNPQKMELTVNASKEQRDAAVAAAMNADQ